MPAAGLTAYGARVPQPTGGDRYRPGTAGEASGADGPRSAAAGPTLEAVISVHGPLLARLVATYEADPARREELWQDVMLALWRALPTFRGEAALRTFVARIAHKRCVSHVARERRRLPVAGGGHGAEPTGDAGYQPPEQLQVEQTFSQLLEAVAALPLGPRQVISLALEGFETAEIAQALGITPNNVAVRLNRARRALRERLDP